MDVMVESLVLRKSNRNIVYFHLQLCGAIHKSIRDFSTKAV
jgi:hypothetical protein